MLRALTCFVLAVISAHAEPIIEGKGSLEVVCDGKPITVFTYKPASYRDGPLLLVFHGINRNAEDYRDFAIKLADEQGFVIAAPLFDKKRFPSDAYVRGNVMTKTGEVHPRSKWTFPIVLTLISELRAREQKPAWDYCCLGHSGGGQFLERFAAFQPSEAKRIVASNPGSHLFPRRDWSGGYGFGGLPNELSNDEALKRYLAAPLTLYLGTADNDPNHEALDKTEAAELQGPHRLGRGRACFEEAQKLAKERGWPFHWRKVETQGIDHDAKKMFAAKEVIEALKP